MNTEDTEVGTPTEAAPTDETANNASEPSPKKKIKRWPIVVGVIAIVVIAAGAGFWVWHEQPGFCNAICHTPMDAYNKTYDQVAGEKGEDKWGNEVSNTNAMMVVTHKDAGEDCLACHVPTLDEQITEGMNWVSGNYVYPLEERTLSDLTKARGLKADQFCLNDACHHVASDGTVIATRDDLTDLTAADHPKRNPHKQQHGEVDCGECHKAHRASVMYCSKCHDDAVIPDGWISSDQSKKLETAI